MDLLRFFTAGNVDDGKSTLIGRLLLDSGSVSTDIVETLTRQSKAKGSDQEIDLALLTDGLRAEREQGITIDVAYKYFSTQKRKFIIADTPGHIQYTRNMFTGASNADLAIILIDARNGVTEQTKRHSIISSVLGIETLVVCINKMDLVNYSEGQFKAIRNEYLEFAKPLGLKNIEFIPVSALAGDNIVNSSLRMSWYDGKPLLQFLEEVETTVSDTSDVEGRFKVQYVIRPQTEELHDYRGYAGQILSGSYNVNEPVIVLPQAIETIISKIEVNGVSVSSVSSGSPAILHLKDDVDTSRGDSILPLKHSTETSTELEALICWMDNATYRPGQKFILQQGSTAIKALIKEVKAHIDIHSFEELQNEEVKLNDICKVKIKLAKPLSYDAYKENKATGSFILVNENTNNTVAAGVITEKA